MSTLRHTGLMVGHTCQQKNDAYGDSMGCAAKMLALLYPNGLRPEQYLDALFAARIFDKQSRLAQGNDPHGEDPRLDIAGYGVLAYHMHKESPRCHGSASGQDAASQSKAQPASADRPTSERTTPSDAASSAPKSWPSLNVSSANTSASASPTMASAPAPTAPESVSGSADVLARGRQRNSANRCARCGEKLVRFIQLSIAIDRPEGPLWLVFCSNDCAIKIMEALS